MDSWNSRLFRMLATVRHYSQVSSIHGMRHVVKVGVSCKERLFWLALVLMGGTHLIVICVTQWDTYRRVPTETVLTDPTRWIEGKLYPCVGLCPVHQIDRRVALRLLRQTTEEVNKSLNGDIHSVRGEEARTDPLHHVSDNDLDGLLLALHKLVSTNMASAFPLFSKHFDALLHLDDHVNVVDFMKRVTIRHSKQLNLTNSVSK
ncbi:Acid-sensing ion channel 1 [Frankliniella fusca]|uniref:Acid-sensing ion channel 1 n=1 Tax=Frankliniella fusca TaxID=407009 RepID=A0AAE1H025_9NEOP|nr:Acid-sensing ion channel 1 [Frankliniella fusca]